MQLNDSIIATIQHLLQTQLHSTNPMTMTVALLTMIFQHFHFFIHFEQSQMKLHFVKMIATYRNHIFDW